MDFLDEVLLCGCRQRGVEAFLKLASRSSKVLTGRDRNRSRAGLARFSVDVIPATDGTDIFFGAGFLR